MYSIDEDHKTTDLFPEEEIAEEYGDLSTLRWENTSSEEYYKNISVDFLKEFSRLAGIDDGCDLDIIFSELRTANNVLDVLSGFGRVIEGLLKRNFLGNIVAIERDPELCRYLSKKFQRQAEVICTDIMDYEPLDQFDAILLLWSALSEFPQHKQSELLTRLSAWLPIGGTIVLDTLPTDIKPRNIYKQDQHFISSSQYGVLHGYLPSFDEIKNYARKAGLTVSLRIHYKTQTHLNRLLYVLKK